THVGPCSDGAVPAATSVFPFAATCVSCAFATPLGSGSVFSAHFSPSRDVHTAGWSPLSPATAPTATNPEPAPATSSIRRGVSSSPCSAFGSSLSPRFQVLRSGENQAAADGPSEPTTTYPADPDAAALVARFLPFSVPNAAAESAVCQVAPSLETTTSGRLGATWS